MSTFILILFLKAGVGADTDTYAVTTAEFNSQAACVAAGNAAVNKFSQGHTNAYFVCASK